MGMAALQNGAILQQRMSLLQTRAFEKKSPMDSSHCMLLSDRMSRNELLGCLSKMRSCKISLGGQMQGGHGPLRAKVEEQSENAEDVRNTTSVAPGASKPAGAKGFGTPKTAVTDRKKASKSSKPSLKPSLPSSSVRRTIPSKPLIGIDPVDPQKQQIETAAVSTLLAVSVLIFVEGLLVAGSGFLPDEMDVFVVKFVYPAFSPSVGLFLVLTVTYGLWKYFGGEIGSKKK